MSIKHPQLPFAMQRFKEAGIRVIGWGVGFSGRMLKQVNNYNTPFVDSFDLLGIRDKINGMRWVPCVSCMHWAFDKTYRLDHEVVVYENKKSKPIKSSLPTMNNEANFEEVVDFLGSAKYVVTSSYHGMYWATLLKKHVIAVPFNSKFYGFPYKSVIMKTYSEKNLSNAISASSVYEDALEECRGCNNNFYQLCRRFMSK